MKIVSIGGGPAGLYFGVLMKQADPAHEITVFERNAADDTFGFGVVFSDATLGNLAAADPETYAEITRHFTHWDDIDIHFGGQRFRSTGHGFCGLERKTLLQILARRCRELGVTLRFETEVDDPAALAGADLILAADGVGSGVRARRAEHFGPDVDHRLNRFVWLGTTFPFEAFTFYFKESAHGLWRVHAYRYQPDGSTFIVEGTEQTWRRAGLDQADEAATIAYFEEIFADELRGHPLVANRSIWRSFPTVRNRRWSHDNIVLVGDAAHTAHFSIGSGTKLAMEDVISLRDALAEHDDIGAALTAYEARRRPEVERLQRAAQVSLEWFEDTERYLGFEPVQFAFSLLTRSLRVTHDNLALRDPAFVAELDRWFHERAVAGCGDRAPALDPSRAGVPRSPRRAPLRLRDLVLAGRVVAAPVAADTPRLGLPEETALVICGPADVTAGFAAAVAGPWRAAAERLRVETGAPVGLRLTHPGEDVAAVDGDAVVSAFAAAADAAAEVGLDLLELDLAAGLPVRLLSPLTNPVPSEYRTRVPLAVVEAVRARWPAARPLAVRISASDWTDGGTTAADAVALARALAAAGCDLVAVTSGGAVVAQSPGGRLYQAAFSDRVRNEAGVPTVCQGGITSRTDVDSVLAAGRADLCAVGPGTVLR